MVAERTPTRYQRIRLFVSSSSPLALYPNTLYSTLSSRADLACSLSCCNPWILSSHPSRSRSTPPLLYIVPRAGNDAPILRFQSGRNRGDPSAIHRISNDVVIRLESAVSGRPGHPEVSRGTRVSYSQRLHLGGCRGSAFLFAPRFSDSTIRISFPRPNRCR